MFVLRKIKVATMKNVFLITFIAMWLSTNSVTSLKDQDFRTALHLLREEIIELKKTSLAIAASSSTAQKRNTEKQQKKHVKDIFESLPPTNNKCNKDKLKKKCANLCVHGLKKKKCKDMCFYVSMVNSCE